MPPKRMFHRQRSVLALSAAILLFQGIIGCSTGATNGGGTVTTPPATINQWTWMGGSDTASGAKSVYGTLGVAAAGNIPGPRSMASTWSVGGSFWLFGGGRFDPLGTIGPRNDLWQFNPSTNQWAWMSGSSIPSGSQIGVYGTLGVAAASNSPGGRSAAVSWADSGGNLWLFGGDGFDSRGAIGILNDLWEFSPSSKQWTWVGGANTSSASNAVYGSLGVAAAANIPGGRGGAVSWVDGSGNFWLFGGNGSDLHGTFGSFNDLWEFNPSSKQWAWVGGANTVDAHGIYGTQGTASASNAPGARVNSVSGVDSSGNLWLFGGLGYDATGNEEDLNDLWQFNVSSKMWTWVAGSNKAAQSGTYGTMGTSAAANSPGGRNAASAWMDSSGNFWVSGGLGHDATGTLGNLNDLWEFNAASRAWTWKSGSNSVGAAQGGSGGQSGVYGTQGTAAAANTPGGRNSSGVWIDSSGSLWLFGGEGHDSTGQQGLLNDLWRYQR